MRHLIMLAVACAAPTALLAQATTAAPEAAPVKEKKVCRQDTNTGSIMPKRTCHTKEEWQQIDQANARATEQFNDQRRGSNHGGM